MSADALYSLVFNSQKNGTGISPRCCIGLGAYNLSVVTLMCRSSRAAFHCLQLRSHIGLLSLQRTQRALTLPTLLFPSWRDGGQAGTAGIGRMTMTCLFQAAQSVVMVDDRRFGKDLDGFLERCKRIAHKKTAPSGAVFVWITS
jgi:hypothetical protein